MGYIFEQEIESIKNAVRARTIGEDETIRLRQVLTAKIHPSVKAYCKAEVEKLLATERVGEIRSKRLPYALPEVARLQQQIDLLLVHYYEFDKTDFESLLDESVHFQFNYLCRPQWTLVNFIFGSNRRVPVAEIEKKLLYCVDYSYFNDLLKRYFIDRGLAEMEYEEFKALVQRIDGEVVARHSSLELATMTRALFTFVASGKYAALDQSEQARLPINAAVVFFEDKRLEKIQGRLEFERDKKKITELSVMELAEIIEAVRTAGDPGVIPQPTNGGDNVPSESVAKVEPHRSEQQEPLPTSQNDVDEARSPGPSTRRSDSEFQPVAVAAPTIELDPQKRLQEYFSSHDRKVYIKSIFRKDAEAFADALEYIDSLKSWDEASLFLDSLFVANNIDPFSVIAVTFTDRVSAKFTSSQKAQ
jgi:hypothetical protein